MQTKEIKKNTNKIISLIKETDTMYDKLGESGKAEHIRFLFNFGVCNYDDLSRKFKLSKTTIYRIVKGDHYPSEPLKKLTDKNKDDIKLLRSQGHKLAYITNKLGLPHTKVSYYFYKVLGESHEL